MAAGQHGPLPGKPTGPSRSSPGVMSIDGHGVATYMTEGEKMTDQNLPQVGAGGFESLKKVNDYGAEYWSARDLQPLLGYSQWRRFENAIKKAVTSCEQSGNEPSHHFASAGKPIPGGKGAVQVVPDFHLSRFACYLIAQNGDPRKPQIANAQKYPQSGASHSNPQAGRAGGAGSDQTDRGLAPREPASRRAHQASGKTHQAGHAKIGA